MAIELKVVDSKKTLQQFIKLPLEIYRFNSKWVPPFSKLQKKYFDPAHNNAFAYSDTILLLAYRNNRPVGRIMGIINHKHNNFAGKKNARFYLFDCYEDGEAASGLLDYLGEWGRNNGMKKLVGPMGFSVRDPEGILIEGFDHEPTLDANYNLPYIPKFLEENKFSKEIDYVVYKIPVKVPEFYERVYERIERKGEYRLLEFGKKKELKRYTFQVQRLMNDSFNEFYGYYPIDEEEMVKLVKDNLMLLDPKFIKLIEREGEIIAFIIGMPNINEGIRKSKGKILPFGFYQIKRAAKCSKQLDLLLGAIDKKYKGVGIDVMLGTAIIRSAINAGFEFIDSSPELESNRLIRAEMEKHGGRIYKRYRIYKKELSLVK